MSKARVVLLITDSGFWRLAVLEAAKIWYYADVGGWAERRGRTVLPILAR